jgi:type II secretory pathway pseudopilin PulG
MKNQVLEIKKTFSIIELLAVILVVLLLLTLLIPTFVNVKMNARAVLCKNQMRQIGVLFSSYSSEYGGYLPNDRSLDIKNKVFTTPGLYKLDNKLLYEGWSGHLLPFLNINIPNYNKRCYLKLISSSSSEIYTDVTPVKSSVASIALDTVNMWPEPNFFRGKSDGGWNVVNDAFEKGGYDSLKVFICPEVFANVYDVGVSIKYNDLRIPRISQMSYDRNESFPMQPGLPTTYLANDIFFGCEGVYSRNLGIEKINSLRMDQISDVSQKVFLIEGGLTQSNIGPSSSYFTNVNEHTSTTQFQIVNHDLTTPSSGFLTSKTDEHKLNFVHDNEFDDFWFYSNVRTSFEIANKFNVAFKGKAEMIASYFNYSGGDMKGNDYSYSIFTHIEPTTAKKTFDDFFLNNPRPSGPNGIFSLSVLFDDSSAFHCLTGKMNVLFGDGAVVAKDRSWLSMNRRIIRTP